VPVAVGGVLFVLPAPAGLGAGAWHYLALFAAVVAALIVEPLPAAACALIGLTIAAALRMVGPTPAESTKWALSGFANDTDLRGLHVCRRVRQDRPTGGASHWRSQRRWGVIRCGWDTHWRSPTVFWPRSRRPTRPAAAGRSIQS
jgi:hypothetical protein